MADFRGKNNTWYCLLSAPGYQFAALTTDTSFLLPRPQLVHGSFFTQAAFTVQGESGRSYTIRSNASRVSFRVEDAANGSLIQEHVGVWKQWWEDKVRVYYKQATVYVRARGWEVNATRRPIYLRVSGPEQWRFDISMRPLKGDTGFEKKHGKSSSTCFPHGIIGQSWDGDDIAVDGRMDDYTFNASHPVVVTNAMAEGALEGRPIDYELRFPSSTKHPYSRYHAAPSSSCAPRNVSILGGKRRAGLHSATAGATDPNMVAVK